MVITMTDLMYCKILKCGDVWEVMVFEKPIKVGFKVHDRIRKEKDESTEKRFDNLVRSRTAVRQLVLCNETRYTKFLTLTYAVTNLDYDQVTKDFKTFVLNLKRQGFTFPYLYVIEHQKERGIKEGNDGSLHIHCLLFTDEYIPFVKLKKAWGKRGSVDIQAIDDIHNLGAYVCKYITKEGYVGSNKPMYHCSRGLKRPVEKALYVSGDATGYEPWTDVKDVLNGLDIVYQNETQYTFDRGQGDEVQRVKYFQGRRKRCKN